MRLLKGGRTFYGQALGVMVLDTKFPRLPGDVANASTYSYPVVLKKVEGATVKRVVKEGGADLLPAFIEAAKELEREGVRAITTSCGFLALHQEALAAAVRVPVFSSSLLLIPLIHRMLGPKERIGVITADASSLTEEHFRAVGVGPDVPLAIKGLEEKEAVAGWLLEDGEDVEVERVEEEVVEAAKELLEEARSEGGEVGALLLECANLPPFAHAIQRATNLPVFDIITLADLVYHAVVKRSYSGFL